MSQPINICLKCLEPIVCLVNFDIYICYMCAAKIEIEKEIVDNQFIELNSQLIKLSDCVCAYSSGTDDEGRCKDSELIIPTIKRSTAIDTCKNDHIILKKDDDLYVLHCLNSYEIRSSITFEIVPNYRYNEIIKCIEKIDPTIEGEDRRLIVLQRNPNAILEEDYKKI